MVGPPSDDDAGSCPKNGLATVCVSALPRANCSTVSWFRLTSGTPRCVAFDPTYATSKESDGVSSRCTVRFHCCTYPDPRLRSTENTPCPSPASGVGSTGATDGPFARTNAGVLLSSVACVTVCTNGNCGIVNGVVIPAWSKNVKPYPERTTV